MGSGYYDLKSKYAYKCIVASFHEARNEVGVPLSCLHCSIMAMAEEQNLESVVRDGNTEDGTVDLKGRPVSRSKTGRWKACSFVLGKHI